MEPDVHDGQLSGSASSCAWYPDHSSALRQSKHGSFVPACADLRTCEHHAACSHDSSPAIVKHK
eukprot:3182000-Amphidinium_carterae.1